ncbi:acyltransferase [Flavobacterium capsici]|uniref:Acyltransferase n=1 Tax=Flavobacterium capsici TaxID=3075618 RepID=A0AA96EU70_9FLAO|nr:MULTISPECIES: acyltransferase [unclassified Flavobacterium]WNM18754.1 acyltransferase [Flavobacterium sp. PMR2A8]WNM22805.1 acyltransferase [Flavobacterium sp. PMTSA4]
MKNFLFVTLRIWKYKFLSNCKKVLGNPAVYHPLLLKGNGKISFGKNVQIGVIDSPNYYSHYTYLEARNNESEINIGNNVSINNAFSAVAFSKITIEDNVLIGVNCSIIDNDGHSLQPDKRNDDQPKTASVTIEENVFLGDNVTILKGVTIGKNSVIGNGSIVTKSIPDNSIAAGNPARVIRNL